MFVSGILWLLSWPAVIFVSYILINLTLKKYDKRVSNKRAEKTNNIS